MVTGEDGGGVSDNMTTGSQNTMGSNRNGPGLVTGPKSYVLQPDATFDSIQLAG